MRLVIILLCALAAIHANAAASVQYLLGEIRIAFPTGKAEHGGISLAKRTLDSTKNVVVEEVLHVRGRGPAEEHVAVWKIKGDRFLVSDSANRFQGAGKLVGKPWKWTSWETTARFEDGSGSFQSKHHVTAQLSLGTRQFFDARGKLKTTFLEEMKFISQTMYETLHSRLTRQAVKDPLG